ncbi:putative PHD type zinc finger protein with BAH domain-containing protein [Curvularia kusanoi]|uniref:PHD type zinc finger protein with BAH domain-containing protein n=1 Tax=Curvularia kusanoi TaxID=90978 RepID=A0A9P4WA50_CURKU|nr:putative PHD type zinc finger protein with BAH domain-containing protein [Curvularia kusanoi]
MNAQKEDGNAKLSTPDSPPNANSVSSKDGAQNGEVNGANAPDDATPLKAGSKASSSRHSTPALSTSENQVPKGESTDATTAMDVDQPNQEAKTTDSDSAQPSRKGSEEAAAAPYGTRSRNRPGRSRINYAEDTEMDFEMTAPVTTNGNASDPPSRSSVAAETAQSSGVSGKKGAGAGQGSAPWGNSGSNLKDTQATISISGSSAATPVNPSSTAAQPATKRRKNAAKDSANGIPASAAAPSQNAKRGAQVQALSSAPYSRESNMMTFEFSGAMLKNGQLHADDGQTVSVNDQVYLVCEPPGEPYYLCRIMEFIHKENDPKQRIESLRVNWFYRPRDVGRYNNDTRLVYATMHSDVCPVASLRGKCKILHRSEIGDLDEYRKGKDSFWFNQVFDRFIHRWYDVIPTSQVINVPVKVKKALDERWKYICLETSRVKELTSAVKSCKRCVGYCASNDSVECAEKKLEARRTPLIGATNEDGEEEEVIDEEEEEVGSDGTSTPDPESQVDLHPGTQAEIALAKMWPMRYLGIHCRVEDALQYDDRAIYPRASSRLGPRHQANVNVWHGQPVEFVKPAEIKKRYVKSTTNKKEGKLTKETVAAIEADKAEKAKRPKWVMDEPAGYVRRGEDLPNKDSKCTAELTFKMPPLGVHSTRGEDDAPTVTEDQVKAYMERARGLAKHVGVEPYNTNFLTKALALFTKHQYDADAALKQVKKLDKRKDLKEPELTKEEEKKWNEGVAKYGSEIRSVRLHTSKTMFYGDAVRYYYMWKKTPKGREIWGSYSNRKGKSKKVEPDAQSRLLDDVADPQDDSAFDNEKAVQRKRNFQCKFCNIRHSRQWRRAPGVSPGQMVPADGRSKDKSGFVVALCLRCANLWRKYAVKWENVEEIAKKVAQGGGKAWKRRIDEELLREVYAAQSDPSPAVTATDYLDLPAAAAQVVGEPAKKKQKTGNGGESGISTPNNELAATKKKKDEKPAPPPKAPTPPPVPAQPRLKRLLWNDKKESVSYTYECVLCPHKSTDLDFYEQPKVTHKKKSDRDREKERLERELIEIAREEYRSRQTEKGRPLIPREPLKRTADNNWVHVYCALWHAEVKFSNANRLDMVEGIGASTLRYDQTCKLCKTNKGACVSCLQCHANFHVGCAHERGYTFGFDMTPVKATRRDAVPTVTLNGDTGTMVAAIWCKEHTPKTPVHPINEEVEGSDITALQLFAREFKQADLTLTGTARKANLVDQSTRISSQPVPITVNRRASAVTAQTPTSARGRTSNAGLIIKEEPMEPSMPRAERNCVRCKIDASPRWWKVEDAPLRTTAVDSSVTQNGVETNGHLTQQRASVEVGSASNGIVDHPTGETPSTVPATGPGRLHLDTNVATTSSTSYLCQKCHWKKEQGITEEDDRERSKSVLPEPQQLPLRSPVQAFVAPLPPALSPWSVPGGPQTLPPNQPPPLPAWHSTGPPGPPVTSHPPHHLQNGLGYPPPPHAPVGHHPPFHPPYAPSNGYPPHTGAPVHPQMPPAPMRPYPAATGPPPPLHLNNGAIMVNGMHSPHNMPYSPTHPHEYHSSRSTESPFAAPPPSVPHYTLHHGSPAPGRPETPRDTVMRDAPVATSAPTERANTGASASPSLRNLLH